MMVRLIRLGITFLYITFMLPIGVVLTFDTEFNYWKFLRTGRG